MSQTSIIFGALFIGFVVYVVMRNEVPKYKSLLLGSQ